MEASMLVQEESPNTTLVFTLTIAAPPVAVFAAWTQPDQLTRWWPQQAEVDLHTGGTFHFGWPSIGQDLRGTYQVVEPDTALAFTWRWDDDTEGTATRVVTLTFAPNGENGTKMTLTHGPYADTPEDQQIRAKHHITGWQFFLPKLAALFSAT
jgi:uncharacterized protein YndB with AHSA1/START domain